MCDDYLIVRQSFEVVADAQVCQTSPQYIDPNTGEAYAYCSQECRAAEVTSQQPQYSPQQQGPPLLASGLLSTGLMYLPATVTCSYPGCTLPATNPDGSGWNYCSQSHKQYANMLLLLQGRLTSRSHSFALNGCIYCRQAEQFGANPLCQDCDRTLCQYAPMLVEVPLDNKLFWDGKSRTYEQP